MSEVNLIEQLDYLREDMKQASKQSEYILDLIKDLNARLTELETCFDLDK